MGCRLTQIFQALVTNETIKSAVFEFVRTADTGEEIVFHRIKVSSARVTEIEQFIDDSDLAPTGKGLEKISLVFQRIEIENLDGKTRRSTTSARPETRDLRREMCKVNRIASTSPAGGPGVRARAREHRAEAVALSDREVVLHHAVVVQQGLGAR